MLPKAGDHPGLDHLRLQSPFPRIKKAVSLRSTPAYKKTAFENVFSSALSRGKRGSRVERSGLTLADYRANPVRVLPSIKKHTALKARIRANTLPEKDGTLSSSDISFPRPGKTSTGMNVPQRSNEHNKESSLRTSLQEKIEHCINKAAAMYRLSPRLLHAVIKAESNFQVTAVSAAGAQGLMQLMPGTASDLGVEDPFDIEQNIDGGARYLRKMLDKFNGNSRLALAAYNAGPGKVIQHRGIPPYRETQQYVERVLRLSG